MKDSLSKIMDRFNWWLFATDIKTVQEVRSKWLEFKQEYKDAIIAEFEELKNKGKVLDRELKAKGVDLNETCNKESNR